MLERTIPEAMRAITPATALTYGQILQTLGLLPADVTFATTEDLADGCAHAVTAELHRRLAVEIREDPDRRQYSKPLRALGVPLDHATAVAFVLNNQVTIQETKPRPSRLAQLFYPDDPPLGSLAQLVAMPKVMEEIQRDPCARGYVAAIADPEKVMALLTEGYKEVTTTGSLGPRWPQLIQGIPCAPGVVGAGDVADALGLRDG